MSDPGNYRPISLTCILCKLLEKHICSIIHEHLLEAHQLYNDLWGFCAKHSTVSALLSIIHEWFSTLECGREVSAVFREYQKVFDSVLHRPLIKKLTNISINKFILQWIINYLTNHSQHVVVSGVSSRSSPVIPGVPRGSVLFLLLFIIYISDLLDNQE